MEKWHEKILVMIPVVAFIIWAIDRSYGVRGIEFFFKVIGTICFCIPIVAIFIGFKKFKFQEAKGKIELEILKANAKRQNYSAEHTICELSGGAVFHVNHLRGSGNYHSKGRSKILDVQDNIEYENQDIEIPSVRETAIDIAMNIDRAIVVGGTRSGKTFFCKQVAHRRIKERGDIVFAIDVKDHDPDDAWCEGVRTVGTGDDYYQIEQFWKWIIAEKKRRGQDMRRTKQEPNILILFDEINVTLYERPDFIAPYLSVLQKFAQYKIGIWAIGQADHKDGLGLPSVALKSNFGATFLFEGENGKHLKNYYRKNPDSCLTTPANSLLLPLYQPVRFECVISENQTKRQPQKDYRAYPDKHDSPDKSDYSDYQKIGYDPEMGGDAVYDDEPIRFFESKAQKTAHELNKKGLTPYQIAKKIFPFVNGQKTAKIKQWLSEM